MLDISKTLYYKNQNDYKFVEPKTPASRRQIVLDDYTLELLSNWRIEQQVLAKTGFVMSYNGIPTQKHTISNAIDRYAKLAGIHRIRIHALRQANVKHRLKKYQLRLEPKC